MDGLDGAAEARGVAVVIDVLRSFTVSAYALAGGAVECRLVTTVEEALELQGRLSGSVVCAEVDGLPVPGIPISNSPTLVREEDLRGRILIQRSSDGTPGVAAAAAGAEVVIACSLVVAGATARYLAAAAPELVTLVAMGTPRGHLEDRLCATYLRRLLRGDRPETAVLLERFDASPRRRGLAAGTVPGFPPSDVELALAVDRFHFAMPVTRDGDSLVLRAAQPDQGSR